MRLLLIAATAITLGSGCAMAAEPLTYSCPTDARYAPNGINDWPGAPAVLDAQGCLRSEPPGHGVGNQSPSHERNR